MSLIFLPKVILVGTLENPFGHWQSLLLEEQLTFLLTEQVLIPQGKYIVLAKPA